MKLVTNGETESFLTGKIKHFSFGVEEGNMFVEVQSETTLRLKRNKALDSSSS